MSEQERLVALCDLSQTRMVAEQKPHTVIVSMMDATFISPVRWSWATWKVFGEPITIEVEDVLPNVFWQNNVYSEGL